MACDSLSFELQLLHKTNRDGVGHVRHSQIVVEFAQADWLETVRPTFTGTWRKGNGLLWGCGCVYRVCVCVCVCVCKSMCKRREMRGKDGVRAREKGGREAGMGGDCGESPVETPDENGGVSRCGACKVVPVS